MQKWEYCRFILREGGTSTRIRLQVPGDDKPKTLTGKSTSDGLQYLNELGIVGGGAGQFRIPNVRQKKY